VKKSLGGLTPAAERLLVTKPWEGNVRELRNVIERACILATGPLITERDLSGTVARSSLTASPAGSSAVAAPAPAAAIPGAVHAGAPQTPTPLAEVERAHLLRALEHAGGNKSVAARTLGLSRRAFYRRLERHGLHVAADAPAAEKADTAE